MDTCPHFNLLAYRNDNGRWICVHLRCKSWTCPYCTIQNRIEWRAFLTKRLHDMPVQWWFGTITAPSWGRTPERTLKAIRTNFDRFWKRLRRVCGSLDYVRIYEVHKDNNFHAHIIVSSLPYRVERYTARNGKRGFRPAEKGDKAGSWAIQTWWKKTLAKCALGYMAEIKPIPSREAVGYITAYMTKDAQNFEVKNLRRVQTSRRIGTPKNEEPQYWQVARHIYGSDVNYQPIVDLSLKTKTTVNYWIDNVVYPPEER